MKPGFRLYLVTDRRLTGSAGLPATCEAILEAVADRFPSGSVALQLREKDLTARELYMLALDLRRICRRTGTALLVNGRVDVALASDADGVHLPGDSYSVAEARSLLGNSRFIGVSTHETAEVAAASRAGADFAVFGPIYPPISKGSYGAVRGVEALKAACAAAVIPVFALGGITIERATELALLGGASLAGVATIGAVFGAESPADAALSMLTALGAPRRPVTR